MTANNLAEGPCLESVVADSSPDELAPPPPPPTPNISPAVIATSSSTHGHHSLQPSVSPISTVPSPLDNQAHSQGAQNAPSPSLAKRANSPQSSSQDPAFNPLSNPDKVSKVPLTTNTTPNEPESFDATATTNPENVDTDNTYYLKWIQWNSGKIPIVMQSKNGPCPLIATVNVLLLREKFKLPQMLEQVTANQLISYLAECLMDSVPGDELQGDENAMLHFEQNIHDAIEVLPKLKTGIDVNIKFYGITDFEYTPECIIFDLLRIPLYHGWLADPSIVELRGAIGGQSYNQIIDNIITYKSSASQQRPRDPSLAIKTELAEAFLDQTASQLTLYGLQQLKSKIADNEIGILFRNNHFLTLIKHEKEIYTLVTDHGYLTEETIVWEILDNLDGAGCYYDSHFVPSNITDRQVSELDAIGQRAQQEDNDYLMALILNETDFELAERLQREENQSASYTYNDQTNQRSTKEHTIQGAADYAGRSSGTNPGFQTVNTNEASSPTDTLGSQARQSPFGTGSQIAEQPQSQAQPTEICHRTSSSSSPSHRHNVDPPHGPQLNRPSSATRGEKPPKDSNCNIS